MDHRPLLKKAGIALVVVGLIDVAMLVVAIISKVSYSSSLNVFAIIAGIFLIKGSLRAASVVQQFALFFVSAIIAITLVSPLILPLGLLLTQIQLNPLLFVGSLSFSLLALGLFLWLISVLGSSAVMRARHQAGLPQRSSYVALCLGVGLAVVLATVSYLLQRSESAVRAISEARAQLGSDYSFHVSSLSSSTNSEGTSIAGVVTAWRSGEIKEYQFRWRE